GVPPGWQGELAMIASARLSSGRREPPTAGGRTGTRGVQSILEPKLSRNNDYSLRSRPVGAVTRGERPGCLKIRPFLESTVWGLAHFSASTRWSCELVTSEKCACPLPRCEGDSPIFAA